MTINNDTFFRPAPPSVRPISTPAAAPPTSHLTTHRLTSHTNLSLNELECVIDYGSLSAHTIGGVVVDSWDSDGCMLLGIDQTARIAFFSDDFSLQVRAYDLDQNDWISDNDPDFPRFALDEDPFAPDVHNTGDDLTIIDLDTGRRHQLIEAVTVQPPSRLSA